MNLDVNRQKHLSEAKARAVLAYEAMDVSRTLYLDKSGKA